MMKHFIKLSGMLLILSIIPQAGLAQEKNDTTALLQKCIELPDLQQFLTMVDNQGANPIVIMQHRILFPAHIAVIIGGERVDFMTKEQVYRLKPGAFFLFEEFRINGNRATVSYLFNYDYTPQASYKIMNVTAVLVREGVSWTFGETKVERR